MKIVLALLAFAIYTPILYYFYSVPFNLLFIDVVFYTFMINILVYVYKYFYSIKGNKENKITGNLWSRKSRASITKRVFKQ